MSVSQTFKLDSPAFKTGENIPNKFTCEGKDISPPLRWTNPPKGTRSFALIVDDPDVPDPDAPMRTWVHWIVYNIPAQAKNLNEGIGSLPKGAATGLNDWKHLGWGGPCPATGKHRYYYKLYALDTFLKFQGPPDKALLENAMAGHILAETELLGFYEKHIH
jgi:Raf kinase inhibitor-like YbhB/YbcL family protein